MPELPEVEVIKRGLAPHLMHQQVLTLTSSNKKLRHPVPKASFTKWIKGETIIRVSRRAKYLLIKVNNGAVFVFHLGMSGRLNLFPSQSGLLRHDHIRISLDNNLELRFNDTRRFGSLQIIPPEIDPATSLFRNVGPEPFSKKFSAEFLLEKARNRRQPIKNFLMDSHIVAGIGNIYANEILFTAGTLPTTPVSVISHTQWLQIIRASRKVLKRAIACGGTTIADYVNSSGESGYFQLELAVYGRSGNFCNTCCNPIIRTVLAGRATYFCSHCQR